MVGLKIFNVGYATNNAIQCIGLDRNGNVYAGGQFLEMEVGIHMWPYGMA
jgi:hypothetical protein